MLKSMRLSAPNTVRTNREMETAGATNDENVIKMAKYCCKYSIRCHNKDCFSIIEQHCACECDAAIKETAAEHNATLHK